jgi:energy-coupling factor transporter ATP-binding protein EcfA2
MSETTYIDDWREERDRARNQRYDVPIISRKEFLRDFSENYRPGQHVTLLGPTGRGKTKMIGQMVIAVQRRYPGLFTVFILHGKIKGRDDTIVRLGEAGQFQMITEGKPTLWHRLRHRHMEKYRNGYIVRPLEKPSTTEEENKLLRQEFGRSIHKGYHANRKHPVILIVDEAHQTQVDLKLKSACEGPLMRGRPVCGEWNNIQRGRFVSQYAYDQAEDVLIFYDPVADNQERYAEIGGVDPKQLKYLSKNLKTFTAPDGSTYSQTIWFHRSGDKLAIVDV